MSIQNQTGSAWQPPVPRPALTPALKRSASVAGAASFVVLSIGLGLLGLAIAFTLFAALFRFIVDLVSRIPSAQDAEFEQFVAFVEQVDPAAWSVPLIIAGILGLILVLAGLFLSGSILRRGGHPKPWAVTWAAWGVGLVAASLVGWVASVPGQLLSMGYRSDSVGQSIATGIVSGIVWVVLSLALNAAIGWLSWWWMAHALRPAGYQPDGSARV